MTFRVSKLAQADLRDIYDYTVTQWGEEQARRYLNELLDAMGAIKETPTRFRIRNDIYPDCRVCLSGRHLIVYRIRDGVVEFGRVLHGAMRTRSHIPDNFMED